MASISVRQLDEKVLAALRQRAAAKGISMEEEVRRILRDAVSGSDLGALMERIFERSRIASDGEDFVIPAYDDGPERPIPFE